MSGSAPKDLPFPHQPDDRLLLALTNRMMAQRSKRSLMTVSMTNPIRRIHTFSKLDVPLDIGTVLSAS